MKRIALWLAGLLLAISCGAAWAAAPLELTLVAAKQNPQAPHMSDHMQFVSVIRNSGGAPAQGVVAWIDVVLSTPATNSRSIWKPGAHTRP